MDVTVENFTHALKSVDQRIQVSHYMKLAVSNRLVREHLSRKIDPLSKKVFALKSVDQRIQVRHYLKIAPPSNLKMYYS